jgi:hypothetical protein
MPTAHVPVSERLSFDWRPTGTPGLFEVEVTESRPRKPRAVRYLVECSAPGSWLFAKAPEYDGERAEDVYEVQSLGGPWACSCPGSQCRHHSLRCKHVLAVLDGIEKGVF